MNACWAAAMFFCAAINAFLIGVNVSAGNAGLAAFAGFGFGWCLLLGINRIAPTESGSA